jgi:hypothetical protein
LNRILEFVLDDIFDSINFSKKKGCFIDADIVIGSNIECILRREGFWNKKLKIVFPCGAIQDIDAENGSYQWDYEIFDGFDKIVANGTCYGNCTIILKDKGTIKSTEFEDIDYVEIINMQLELHDINLTRIEDKVKVMLI